LHVKLNKYRHDEAINLLVERLLEVVYKDPLFNFQTPHIGYSLTFQQCIYESKVSVLDVTLNSSQFLHVLLKVLIAGKDFAQVSRV
jgi:hypothetical protein